MTTQEFKRLVKDKLLEYGFRSKGGSYSLKGSTLVAVVNVQKSSYSESFYINYGFAVDVLHSTEEVYRLGQCDITGRIAYKNGKKDQYIFDLESVDMKSVSECIDNGLKNCVFPVLTGGIEKYFQIYPNAIFAVKMELRKYLEANQNNREA